MKKKHSLLLSLLISGNMFVLKSTSNPERNDDLNTELINQEIKHSLREHDRQKELREEQLLNTASESYNESQWKETRTKIEKIQDRLRVVALSLQLIPMGIAVVDEGKKISEIQKQIFEELKDSPTSIVLVYKDQIKFIDDLQMVVRLLTGIVVSYGSINQMERADRQELINYALDEVRMVRYNADDMLWKIKAWKSQLRAKKSVLEAYVQRDKQIIKEIIGNVKSL